MGKRLVRVVAAPLRCFQSVSDVTMICVEEDLVVGRALASVMPPTVPVVTGIFGLTWLHAVICRPFTNQLGVLDPCSVPDFLKCRLAGVIDDHRYDKMPDLRQVLNFVSKNKGKETICAGGVRNG